VVNIPVPKGFDITMVGLSVMPRLADGHIDTAAVITWASDAPDQVGVKPGTWIDGQKVETFPFQDPQFPNEPPVDCPGDFNCFGTTPLASGTGNVTASCPGYEPTQFGPIVYEPGAPRSLNGSVGQWVPEF
jgi:hypothetical protein